MAQGISYWRRGERGTVRSEQVGEAFAPWQGPGERWLFVAPHDDDIVAGAGITFLAALAEGIEVHAAVTTDGRMGYCRPEQRQTISQVRQEEARRSFALLGLPAERLSLLRFPDCSLTPYRGRRLLAEGQDDPAAIAGAVGLQNSFPHLLRKVRPTRVFLPSATDLHPDHQIVNAEMQISLFHAQGSIWPELGAPIESIPALYEYATYSDFASPPEIRVGGTAAMLRTKLEAIRAYASQEQIELLVEVQRNIGPVEFIREVRFPIYAPQQYEAMFRA